MSIPTYNIERRAVDIEEVPRPNQKPPIPPNVTRIDGPQLPSSTPTSSAQKQDAKAMQQALPQADEKQQPPQPPIIEGATLLWHKTGTKKPVKLYRCELLADGTFRGYSDKKGTQACI